MDRQAWLAERRTGIGSSDVAAICGMSQWGGPLDVYCDKLGVLPDRPNESMRWGLKLEGVIAEAFTEETGLEVAIPRPAIYRNSQWPWMLASPDRVCDTGDIVELKTARTAEGWGEPGTDQVPEAYLLQVQHQLACVPGSVNAHIAVLIGGSDFRVYKVLYNTRIIAKLAKLTEDFWKLVQSRTPPPVDWGDPHQAELAELLRQPVAGKAIEFPDAKLINAYEMYGMEIKKMESERAAIRSDIIRELGDAEYGILPDGRRVIHRERHRAGYTVEASKFWELRILKGGKP